MIYHRTQSTSMGSSKALSSGADNINPTKPKIRDEKSKEILFNIITQQPESSANGCVENLLLQTRWQLSPSFNS